MRWSASLFWIKSSLKCWLCLRLFFWPTQKKTFSYDFVAPLADIHREIKNLLVNTSNIIQEDLPWKLEQWIKKCVIVSASLPQSHNGFRVSWKQYVNLWSQRWMRIRRTLVRSLIPYGLWILKIILAQGRIRFRRFLLKTGTHSEFLTSQSGLFHSDIVEGKNGFLK